jgi:hypothetical protein
MHIEKDVSEVLRHGTTNLTTANTPSQVVTDTSIKPMKGVQLKAGIDNAGVVYVGNSGVGNTVSAATCGLPLDAGEAVFLPVEDPTRVFANNATANDIIHWVII